MDDQESTTLIVNLEPSFPGYTTVRELGSGGMAQVYLARDEALDRLVAIKVMNQELLSPEFLARFDGEAKTAAQFRHPNIVGVFASGESDGRPYIVFEYAPGGTLEQRLAKDAEVQNGPLPELEALQIGNKLAQALAYLHDRKIIHRDIKPANIVFNEQDEPLLSDFGIAKALETDADLTQPGLSIGSPRYMSPEQLRGEQISEKSDIYSFGLLLVQMLHGRSPQMDASKAQDLDMGRCTKLVVSCLATNPSVRPSAPECVVQLEKAIRDASGPWTKQRMLLGAASLVGLALIAVLATQPAIDSSDSGSPGADGQVAQAVPVLVSPDYAKLIVDGRAMDPTAARVLPGRHELLAVAPGFGGYYAKLEATQGASIDIQLPPLTLPTLAQFQKFHAAFDESTTHESSDGLNSPALPKVGYPLYDRLLAIQLQLRNPAGSSSNLAGLSALRELAAAGDADSQVGAFLLASEDLGGFSPQVTAPGLRDASTNGGFGLATYYRALALRQEAAALVASEGTIDQKTRQQLAQLMRLALDQGLDFAAAELQLLE